MIHHGEYVLAPQHHGISSGLALAYKALQMMAMTRPGATGLQLGQAMGVLLLEVPCWGCSQPVLKCYILAISSRRS